MTLRDRLRVIWAAMTKGWQQRVCSCGQTQWVEGESWIYIQQCHACESRSLNEWAAAYERRQGSVS